MVLIWYMSEDESDQRLEHHRIPPAYLDTQELYQLTGVEYFQILPISEEVNNKMEEIKTRRGYTYEDEITCSKDCLPNYEEKLKNFYQEHLHTDEEIRLVLAGSGYFDVRDIEDNWIRIKVTEGDMIVIPSGIYHRFTLDTNDFIRAKRFFIGEPVWLPYNRPSDDMDCRKNYLQKVQTGVFVK